MAARCKLPFALHPGPSQEKITAHQRKNNREEKGQTKERSKEKKRTEEPPVPYSSPADAMKAGVEVLVVLHGVVACTTRSTFQ